MKSQKSLSGIEAEIVRRTGFDLASISDLIDNCDVVSFDIFDTLLARFVLKPVDVFDVMEKTSRVEGFSAARQKAERLARHRFGSKDAPEVSIEEIYEVLDVLLPGHGLAPEVELVAEEKFLFADPTVGAVLDLARQKRKLIVGISDMYLSNEQISRLLKKNGIDLDEIYSSCDYRRQAIGKFNRRMFKFVAEKEGFLPERILHFGDNLVADVENAMASGVSAIHIRPRRDFVKDADAPFLCELASHNTMSANLILGQIAARLPHLDPGVSDLYTYGFNMCGPLLLGFCNFIAEKTEREEVERLLLIARDGYIIKDALDILQLSVPEYSVIPLSRRLVVFPLGKQDPNLFNDICLPDMGKKQTGRDHWASLNLDPSIIEGHPKADTKLTVRNFGKMFSDALSQVAKVERVRLECYLKNRIGNNPSKVALVDVGWGLSTFEALDQIVKPNVQGYFVGIHKSAYNRNGLTGYLFNGPAPLDVETNIMKGVELIELLFSHPIGGVISLDEKNGDLVPKHEQISAAEKIRNIAAQNVHRGALDFLRLIARMTDALDNEEVRAINQRAFSRLVSKPTDREYRAFANIPHSRYSGHGTWQNISDLWRPDPVDPKAPIDMRANLQLQNYELFLPKVLTTLSVRDDIGGMSWKSAMRRHPLKVSYWNAIRRYLRRTNTG